VPRKNVAIAARPRLTSFQAPTADACATVAACAVDAVNAVLASASANSLALSNRSAANFSNDFATAAATLGGTAFRNLVTGCTCSAKIFITIA
jgi:hypothetical protein